MRRFCSDGKKIKSCRILTSGGKLPMQHSILASQSGVGYRTVKWKTLRVLQQTQDDHVYRQYILHTWWTPSFLLLLGFISQKWWRLCINLKDAYVTGFKKENEQTKKRTFQKSEDVEAEETENWQRIQTEVGCCLLAAASGPLSTTARATYLRSPPCWKKMTSTSESNSAVTLNDVPLLVWRERTKWNQWTVWRFPEMQTLLGRLTLTVSCCRGRRLSGSATLKRSFPLSSSVSAFCPATNCSGIMPIPTSWLLWSFSKLSAMTARTPWKKQNKKGIKMV